MTDVPHPDAPKPLAPIVGGHVYPAELERVAVLADGRRVTVRPIRPDDEPILREAIAAADEETLHARFLGAPPRGDAAFRRLVDVDYRNRLALVAFGPDGAGAGVARYAGDVGQATAEVAVAIDPAWRRVGLGSLLLRELGEAAVRRGIHRFTALVLSDNRPVTAVLRASGIPYSLNFHGGTSDIVMALERPPATLTGTADG